MTDLRADVDARLTELETILARGGLLRKVGGKVWDELLHPRGRDGKFIEKNGFVTGNFQVADASARPVAINDNNRAKVTGFSKNPDNPDDPYVNVDIMGTPARALASQVQMAAPTKGVLRRDDQGDSLPNAEVGPREIPEGSDSLAEADVPEPEPEPEATETAPADEPTVDAPFAPSAVGGDEGAARSDITRQLDDMADGDERTALLEELKGLYPSEEDFAAEDPEHHQEWLDASGDEGSEFDDSASDITGDFNPPDPNKQTLTPADIAKVQQGPGDPVETDDVEEALELLARGEKVKLSSEDKVAVLLDRMLEVYNDAKAKGEEAPQYNLCNVTVQGTNLFCTESKNINRIYMPQLKGIPLPGTPAAQMTPDTRGEVDLSDDFRKHLEGKGVKITDEDVQASHLKATQDELNGSKTAGIGKAIESGKYDEARIFVSRDNYIVDGHHRWSATLGVDLADGHAGDLYMPVAVIDMDILDILAEANDFSISQGIPQADVGEPTPWQPTDLNAAEAIDYDGLTPEQRDFYAAARRAKKTHEQAMAAAKAAAAAAA